jgi:hypothetical protein
MKGWTRKPIGGSRVGRITLLAALLVAAVATVALAAHHKGDKSSRDAKIKATPAISAVSGGHAIERIDCDKGKRVVGGGALPNGSNFPTSTAASGPVAKDGHDASGWFANMRSTSVRDYKFFVICSKRSDATIKTQAFDVNDGSATITCPSGTRALSGGVLYDLAQSNLTGVLRVEQSGPLDAGGSASSTNTGDIARSWFVGVGNPTGPDFGMTAVVVCSKASKAKLKVVPFETDGDEHESAVAACPNGTRLMGGGVVQVGSLNAAVVIGGPRDGTSTVAGTKTGDVGRDWLASVQAIGGDGTSWKVEAICG